MSLTRRQFMRRGALLAAGGLAVGGLAMPSWAVWLGEQMDKLQPRVRVFMPSEETPVQFGNRLHEMLAKWYENFPEVQKYLDAQADRQTLPRGFSPIANSYFQSMQRYNAPDGSKLRIGFYWDQSCFADV